MSSLITAGQPADQGIPIANMAHSVCVRLPRDPRCGAIARRVLEVHARARISVEALADAKSVITELVNNAYLHGEGTIELRMTLLADRIRIEVIDEGKNVAIGIRDRPAPDCGGNGLRLVDSLALRWGARPGPAHVWADVRV